jgi:hypothetical protein
MTFPSDTFAAFLAHLLNESATPTCTIDIGHLYARLTDALAAKYKDTLLYHTSYRFRMSEAEAARAYFEVTIERGLWLSNKVEMSVAHLLLLAMCRRGVGAGWPAAELRRQTQEPRGHTDVASLLAVGSFNAVASRLQKVPSEISSGNPAANIRQRRGTLWLMAGYSHAQVPEEISTWNAIVCGPTVVQTLAAGEPFNRFCGVVIDAVRTANRPIQELLSLGRGICPFDWIDVLSINQVRGLRLFLQEVAESDEPDSLDLWTRVWDKTKVPGFRSVADLWSSEIGHTLRNPIANAPPMPLPPTGDPRFSPAGTNRPRAMDAKAWDEQSSGFLDRQEFEQHLAVLKSHSVISAVEQTILMRVYVGDTLSELAKDKAVLNALRERRMKFPQLIADLQDRISNWQIPEGAHHG